MSTQTRLDIRNAIVEKLELSEGIAGAVFDAEGNDITTNVDMLIDWIEDNL